jgi:hypothetical protein
MVCWHTAPEVIVIYQRQIIVYKRCGMHHFYSGRIWQGVLYHATEKAAKLKHKYRSYTLSARKKAIALCIYKPIKQAVRAAYIFLYSFLAQNFILREYVLYFVFHTSLGAHLFTHQSGE